MSRSDRLSDRVEEAAASDLMSAGADGSKGADGSAVAMHVPSERRVSHRQLQRLKSSLSDRDFSILLSLERLHYLTTGQIERLLFQGSGLTPLAAARGARRTLARLHGLGVVHRLHRRIGGVRAGSTSYVLTLSSLGARLLAVPTRRRLSEPGVAHLDHVLAVGELVVRLHEEARTGKGEVLSLAAEPECWRSFVGDYGSRALLKPDLRVTLAGDDDELHWFVEIDRGSEHRPVLARKLLTYLAAWRSGHEQASVGVFPRVLWVVPHQRRAEVIESVWRSLPGVPDGMFLATITQQAPAVLWGGSV